MTKLARATPKSAALNNQDKLKDFIHRSKALVYCNKILFILYILYVGARIHLKLQQSRLKFGRPKMEIGGKNMREIIYGSDSFSPFE